MKTQTKFVPSEYLLGFIAGFAAGLFALTLVWAWFKL